MGSGTQTGRASRCGYFGGPRFEPDDQEAGTAARKAASPTWATPNGGAAVLPRRARFDGAAGKGTSPKSQQRSETSGRTAFPRGEFLGGGGRVAAELPARQDQFHPGRHRKTSSRKEKRATFGAKSAMDWQKPHVGEANSGGVSPENFGG